MTWCISDKKNEHTSALLLIFVVINLNMEMGKLSMDGKKHK